MAQGQILGNKCHGYRMSRPKPEDSDYIVRINIRNLGFYLDTNTDYLVGNAQLSQPLNMSINDYYA